MEELDFQELLDRFGKDSFQKGEQIILANFGTNQTLLSLIFGVPNEVHVIDQVEKDGQIIRQVNLTCGGTIVCYANTKIPRARNQEDVLKDISAGQLGLGQIVVVHNLPTKRALIDIGRDSSGFWRTYAIDGLDIYLEIHEYFPREPFEEIGWIHKKGSKMAITDDEGETFQFSKFVAIGVQDDGSVFLGIEDEGLTRQEAMEVVLQGAQVVGEMANMVITSGLIEGKEEIDDGE